MKYNFYTCNDTFVNKSSVPAQTIDDYLHLYSFLIYRKYALIQDNFNQYIGYLLKRALDLVISSAALIAGFPFFIFLVIITKATSGGSVIFRQERIGKNGNPFYLYKLRSMYINAEVAGPQLSKDNDPRVTAWGKIMRKSHIDELPQFVNVFLGQMSVVGPRPERLFYIEKIIEKAPEYKKLLSIKPGITSIGQVRYGYAENVDQMIERMQLDLLYLNSQRLSVDMGIIAETVTVMAQGKGK